MAKSRDQLIDEMLDREAIRELPSRYCHCVWSGDADGLADLYTEDGEFIDVSAGRETKGREKMRRMIQRAMESIKPRPFIHNVVIELLGDGRARGWAYVELRLASRNMEGVNAGYYEDQFQKEDGQWKFKSRRMHLKQA